MTPLPTRHPKSGRPVSSLWRGRRPCGSPRGPPGRRWRAPRSPVRKKGPRFRRGSGCRRRAARPRARACRGGKSSPGPSSSIATPPSSHRTARRWCRPPRWPAAAAAWTPLPRAARSGAASPAPAPFSPPPRGQRLDHHELRAQPSPATTRRPAPRSRFRRCRRTTGTNASRSQTSDAICLVVPTPDRARPLPVGHPTGPSRQPPTGNRQPRCPHTFRAPEPLWAQCPRTSRNLVLLKAPSQFAPSPAGGRPVRYTYAQPCQALGLFRAPQ
mmetsp:Transcript_41270/g.132959  ORF Transcript_41270/g.132959 Transcript_41270/m.132959 type:complete len:271 (+) Transcript_41270:87-899(+)